MSAHRPQIGPVEVLWPKTGRQSNAPHANTSGASPGPQQLVYSGGIKGRGVAHHPRLYIVFWGSQWDRTDPYVSYELNFFRGLYGRGDDWTPLLSEYCDHVATGSVSCGAKSQRIGRPSKNALVKGVWFDNSAPAVPTDLPVVRINGLDSVANEATKAAAHFGNASAPKNVDAIYLINTPSHFSSLGFGAEYCAYHSSVDASYGPVAFADMPYNTDFSIDCGQDAVNPGAAGRYDGVSIVAGHEVIEAITDLYPTTGWAAANGDENADKCAWVTTGPGRMSNLHLATGTFAVQGGWSNLANNGSGGCRTHAR